MYKTSQKTFNTAWSKDGLNWKFRGYVKLDDIKVDYDGEPFRRKFRKFLLD